MGLFAVFCRHYLDDNLQFAGVAGAGREETARMSMGLIKQLYLQYNTLCL